MEINDGVIAYFITWTVYGTFLQGDARWWRKRNAREQAPQPLLEQWHRDRLNHKIELLKSERREVVEQAVANHCQHRGWKVWVVNARSNHVHAVVTAPGYTGDKVRDQLKANCTRALRGIDPIFQDRPVWTTKGDVEHVKKESDLDQVIVYAGEAQDRMERGK